MKNDLWSNEKVRVNMVMAEESGTAELRGRIDMPGIDPGMKVVSHHCTVIIKRAVAKKNMGLVEGLVFVEAMCSHRMLPQGHSGMHLCLPFSMSLNMPGAESGMDICVYKKKCQVDLSIERASWDCINVEALITITAKVTKVAEIETVAACPAGCICERTSLPLGNMVENKKIMLAQEHVIEFSQIDRPIVDVMATADIASATAQRGSVLLEGTFILFITYKAGTPFPGEHCHKVMFNFNRTLDVPGALPGMDVSAGVMVERVDYELLEDDHHRGAEVEENCAGCMKKMHVSVMMGVSLQVYEPRVIGVITSISGCEIAAKFIRVKYDILVGENSVREMLEETVETPFKKKVCKILETTARSINLMEPRVGDGMVTVMGHVDAKVLYQAEGPQGPVMTLYKALPFHTGVKVHGARSGMDVHVMPSLEFIKSEARGCLITINAALRIKVRVTHCQQADVLTGISIPMPPPPEPPCIPGTTFPYVVRPGDTLYKIANRYGISLNQLIKANPQIANPDLIDVGMVINIPCVPKG